MIVSHTSGVFDVPHILTIGWRSNKIGWWKLYPVFGVVKFAKKTPCHVFNVVKKSLILSTEDVTVGGF